MRQKYSSHRIAQHPFRSGSSSPQLRNAGTISLKHSSVLSEVTLHFILVSFVGFPLDNRFEIQKDHLIAFYIKN